MIHSIRYRIESRKNKNGQRTYFYLIREFKVEGKRCVIAKYIKSGSYISSEEITEFLTKNIFDIEKEAREKYLKIRQNVFTSEYMDESSTRSIEYLRYLHLYLNSLISVDEIAEYERKTDYQYIHGTTFIEGNTLTYGETTDLLEHGILPKGKKAREVFEVQNFKDVIAYRNAHTGKLTLSFIRGLHKRIMKNILSESGNFRTTDDILISGYDYQVTPSLLIEEELEHLITEYYQNLAEGYNPFECAVMFHYRFETIHPFTDGNGRVGRELLNYLLKKANYPLMLVPGEKRAEYLAALHYGNTDDFRSMMKIFVEILTEQRMSAFEKNFRQQLEIRVTGSYENSTQHNLSEFFK